MTSPNMTNLNGVTVTDSTLAVTADGHSGVTVVLSRAAGITVTLPEATGSFAKYRFVIATTVTSNDYIIQVTGDDTMQGRALLTDGNVYDAGATADTITMNGTTKGGILGTVVECEDIAADKWHVFVNAVSSGTEATPFSAAVS